MPTANELAERMKITGEFSVKIVEKKNEYQNSVLERIKQYSVFGEIEIGGIKKMPDDYCIENNVEYQKFVYFFRCIDYNPEICEMILHPKAHSTRAAIIEQPLSYYMIKSLRKD